MIGISYDPKVNSFLHSVGMKAMCSIYDFKNEFFIEEFDNEEVFKKEILRIINNGGIIGKVWIKEEPDDYEPLIKL